MDPSIPNARRVMNNVGRGPVVGDIDKGEFLYPDFSFI